MKLPTNAMKNVFIINAHLEYPFAKGRLNAAFVDQAKQHLTANGYNVKETKVEDGYDVDTEIEKHQWADAVLLQSPVNWMGMPWTFKKYEDLVYTAGMDGRLCNGDGRSRSEPEKIYGSGGTLPQSKYMMSLTFNAPGESFDDMAQFFDGKSVDDLMFPMHMNFKFFGMEPMETFCAFDVMKNPQVEKDFERFAKHLETHFPPVESEKDEM